jgi:head-tail adaptor
MEEGRIMAFPWKYGRLEAGKLRHRIDIVQVSSVQDSAGGFNLSADVVYANVWASMESLDGGTEQLVGQAQTSIVPSQCVIRYIDAAPSWQALTYYLGGTVLQDSGGYLQKVLAPGGLSGAEAPTWNEVQGQYTYDGDPSTGCIEVNIGIAPPYTGVTAAMQVWWQGRQFQIKNVLNPDGRNKMLVLMLVEIDDSRQQLNTSQPGDLG